MAMAETKGPRAPAVTQTRYVRDEKPAEQRKAIAPNSGMEETRPIPVVFTDWASI